MSKEMTVKQEENGLALSLHGNATEGLENVDRSSLSVPRVKLLQSTSPEVQGDEYRDLNLRAGDLIDTLSKDKVEADIIPIKVMPATHALFVPRTAEGKAELKNRKSDITDADFAMSGTMICTARDGVTGDRFGNCASCGLCKFVGNNKPLCSRAINILVMSSTGPMILTFRDTSYKHGNKFLSLLTAKAAMGMPIQAMKFKMQPLKKQVGDKQWYELNILPAGTATQEEYDSAYQMFKAFNDVTIVADEDTVTPDAANTSNELI